MLSPIPALRSATLLAALATALACASSSPGKPDPGIQYTGFDARSGRFTVGAGGGGERPTDVLLVNEDRAWELLSKAYESLGLTPTYSDPTKKVIGVQNLVTHKPVGGERLSRLLDCGVDVTGPNADYYEVHLTVMSGVQATDSGGSKVTTRVAAWAAPNGLSSSVRCASTGRIEERIAIAMGIAR
jgi:hypothetical protein